MKTIHLHFTASQGAALCGAVTKPEYYFEFEDEYGDQYEIMAETENEVHEYAEEYIWDNYRENRHYSVVKYESNDGNPVEVWRKEFKSEIEPYNAYKEHCTYWGRP